MKKKLSDYINEVGDGNIVGIYDKEQIKQMSSVGKVKYIAIVEEDKVFEPKAGEWFWILDFFGDARAHKVLDSNELKKLTNYQQVYRKETEAEFARDKAIFLEFMRKEFLRNSDEIDWKDKLQMKYYFQYAHYDDCITRVFTRWEQEVEFYTTDRYWLADFIDEHEDDIKRYYFEVKENENEKY